MGRGDFKDFDDKRKMPRVWHPPCRTVVKPDGTARYWFMGKAYVEVKLTSLAEELSRREDRWFSIMSRR